jgi:hypothetical protein
MKVVHMAKRSLHGFLHTARPTAITFRSLAGQLDVLLVGTFPDLRDAFDADELPLEFILKRDSSLPETIVKRRTATAAPAKGVLRRRKTTYRREQRIPDRMQTSDE